MASKLLDMLKILQLGLVAILTTAMLSACQVVSNNSIPSAEIKPGVSLSRQPKSPKDVELARPELIQLILDGKVSAAEAKAWLIESKKRVGIPNPEQTKGFDAMLLQAGIK